MEGKAAHGTDASKRAIVNCNWDFIPQANCGGWGETPVLELSHPRGEKAGILQNNLHLSGEKGQLGSWGWTRIPCCI